jgi:hypothetical protein
MNYEIERQLLRDLAGDSELSGFVSNLEGMYLERLEAVTQRPEIVDGIMNVRRQLAQTRLALKMLGDARLREPGRPSPQGWAASEGSIGGSPV